MRRTKNAIPGTARYCSDRHMSLPAVSPPHEFQVRKTFLRVAQPFRLGFANQLDRHWGGPLLAGAKVPRYAIFMGCCPVARFTGECPTIWRHWPTVAGMAVR